MATREQKSGTDVLWLSGVEGLLEKQRIAIRPGQTVLVGRSRRCDLSTRRSRPFLTSSVNAQRRLLADPEFNRVSRAHFRITVGRDGEIEVRDLSRNGTFLNGTRIGRVVLRKLDGDGVEIRMGSRERLRLHRA